MSGFLGFLDQPMHKKTFDIAGREFLTVGGKRECGDTVHLTENVLFAPVFRCQTLTVWSALAVAITLLSGLTAISRIRCAWRKSI